MDELHQDPTPVDYMNWFGLPARLIRQ